MGEDAFGFCAFLGVAALVSVLLKVGDGDTRRFEPLTFPFIFGAWCVITMALTKGTVEKGTGVQVDLLLQTNRCVYVIEVKRRSEIKHEVIDEVDEKVRRIKHRRGVAFKTALIYVHGD